MTQDHLRLLRRIGPVADLRAAAAPAPVPIPNNPHIHLPPNFSAFTTVAQAVELADRQNCRIVGASNYYDYNVYTDFARLAQEKNIFPLFGLEIICMIDDLRAAGTKINDPGNPGKMYICGKGITRFTRSLLSQEGQRILNTIRQADSLRTSQMIARISLVLADRGLPNAVTADTVIGMIVKRHGSRRQTVFIQERHVAQAFQEFIFAAIPAAERIARLTTLLGAPPKLKSPDDFVGVQNEIRSQLMKAGKPGYVTETFIDFAPVVRLILELGGFPCYPILADGNNPICGFEDPVDKLVASLKERCIYAAELIPGRNSPAVVEAYARAIRAAGLIVTAGTEHNTLDLISMVPACRGDAPIPGDLQRIFYEGACVIAAHQFLVAHGQTGYVDSAGNLNPEYASAEDRIADLAKLGDTVIHRYLKTSNA